MKQTTFASLAWNAKGRTTRRERFLAEMNAVMPWARLTALIEPHYPKDSVRPCRWSGCCGCTSCSNGSICPIRKPRMRSTTLLAPTWTFIPKYHCLLFFVWCDNLLHGE
jgi:hypothetical protein